MLCHLKQRRLSTMLPMTSQHSQYRYTVTVSTETENFGFLKTAPTKDKCKKLSSLKLHVRTT